MNLLEQLEARRGAVKVAEICALPGVDDEHIYLGRTGVSLAHENWRQKCARLWLR